MMKKLLAGTLASVMVLGTALNVSAAEDASTQGKNTFVDGATDLNFWTFRSEEHTSELQSL